MPRMLVEILANLPGISGFSLYGVVRHPIKAFFIYPYLSVKWFIQRGRRGYSDCDAWNLGSYLGRWMPTAVRSLKNGNGVPAKFLDVETPTEQDMARYRISWNNVLENIALGFEAGHRIENELPLPDSVEFLDLEFKRIRGLQLFIEWHQNLWD